MGAGAAGRAGCAGDSRAARPGVLLGPLCVLGTLQPAFPSTQPSPLTICVYSVRRLIQTDFGKAMSRLVS